VRLVVFVLAFGPAALAREPEAYPKFPARLDTAATVRTAARLAHALRDALVAERLDIPPDVVADAQRACLAASAGALPADVRAEAVQCAADLGADVTSFLADEAPAIRATAAALAGPRARAQLTVLATDKDPLVAATALGLLCADDAARTLRELDDRGRARLATLGADKTLDRGVAARLAPCRTTASRRRSP
jgi:hypothetical protein